MSVFSSKRLENKTVLVTGASAGIGEASISYVFESYN
jgi:NADP-dependent 3-hydroxy acid dehydrogenase YdfG